MKKLKVSIFLLMMGLSSLSQAQQCDKKNDLMFGLALKYNNLVEEDNALKSGCVKLDEKTKIIIVNQTKTLESLKLIEKYMPNLDIKDFKGLNKIDWFSMILVKEIFKSKFEFNNIEEEKYTQSLINKTIDSNKFNYNWKQSADDSQKLIQYIAEKYKKGYELPKDNFDNFALTYIILANKPELINYAYTGYEDKKIWLKVNKNKYTPLHFMFSPLLKGKDVTKLNDQVLKEVPVTYLINIKPLNILEGKIYDYFQFAELMKNNNPDFYKKLKDKYKFQINALDSSVEATNYLKNTLSLNDIPLH